MTEVVYLVLLVAFVVGVATLLYGTWRVLANLAKQPGPVVRVSRLLAFKRLFLVHLLAWLPVVLMFAITLRLDDRKYWLASGLFFGLICAGFACAAAYGVTGSGWRFRVLLRWTRKRLGIFPGP